MEKGRLRALLPIGVFLVSFLGMGIISGDFNHMPTVVGFLLALMTAFFQNRSLNFDEKIKVITKGVGDENIITMCLIFLAAGGFSGAVGSGRCGQHRQFLSLHPAVVRRRYGSDADRMLYFPVHGDQHGNYRRAGSDRGGHQ